MVQCFPTVNKRQHCKIFSHILATFNTENRWPVYIWVGRFSFYVDNCIHLHFTFAPIISASQGRLESYQPVIILPINGGKLWFIIGVLRVSIPPRSRSAPSLKFKASRTFQKVPNISISLNNGRMGRRCSWRQHVCSYTHSSVTFSSRFASRFPPCQVFLSSVSFPAGQQCSASSQLSRICDGWKSRCELHAMLLQVRSLCLTTQPSHKLLLSLFTHEDINSAAKWSLDRDIPACMRRD